MLRQYASKHRRQTCSTPRQLHVDRYLQDTEEPTLVSRTAWSRLPLKGKVLPTSWLAAGLLCMSNGTEYRVPVLFIILNIPLMPLEFHHANKQPGMSICLSFL